MNLIEEFKASFEANMVSILAKKTTKKTEDQGFFDVKWKL